MDAVIDSIIVGEICYPKCSSSFMWYKRANPCDTVSLRSYAFTVEPLSYCRHSWDSLKCPD